MDRPAAGGFLSLTAFQAEGCGGGFAAKFKESTFLSSLVHPNPDLDPDLDPDPDPDPDLDPDLDPGPDLVPDLDSNPDPDPDPDSDLDPDPNPDPDLARGVFSPPIYISLSL